MGAKRDEGPNVEFAAAQQFDSLEVQLQSFYSEISGISAKKPDSPINKFKLTFINQTLRNVNRVLGDAYVPFPDFRTFDEADLPTASDVVMMLAQYLECMDRFFRSHTYFKDHTYLWRTSDRRVLEATRTNRHLNLRRT